MKKIIHHLKFAFATVMLLGTLQTQATVFTAVANGNFSSTSTWAGGVAPLSLVLGDQIVIGSGYTVNLDQNSDLLTSLNSLTVNGTLTSSTNTALRLNATYLYGTGNIVADSAWILAGSMTNFTGNMTANYLMSSSLLINNTAHVTVNKALYLMNSTWTNTTGTLDVAANANLIFNNGNYNNGGTGGFSNMYNVIYLGGNASGGVELSDAHLQNLTLNQNSGSNVTLTDNTTINGMLTLQSGNLILNGNNLTFGTSGNFAATGTGAIHSSSSSDIAVNASAGLTGALRFTSSGNHVGNLTVSSASATSVMINNDLTVHGTLFLTSGSLNVDGHSLTVMDDVIGSGILSANNSDLTFSGSSSLSNNLFFNSAGNGNSIHNLTLNLGSGHSAMLGSSLVINGQLTLSNGSVLNFSGRQLTLNGNTSGTGYLQGDANAILILNSAQTSGLNFGSSAGTLATLIYNGGGSGSNTTNLMSNLNVMTVLQLQSGVLNLNGHHLNLNGMASGTGQLHSTSASNITITSASSSASSLSFTASGHTVGNLSINNTGTGMWVINSDLNISGNLSLNGGIMDIGANDLEIMNGGTITGGSSTSYVNTESGGSLIMHLAASGSGMFHVGNSSGYAPAMVTQGTGTTASAISITAKTGVYAQGSMGSNLAASGHMVNNTWFVESDNMTNVNLSLKAMWGAGLEVNGFNHNNAYLSHYTSGNWDMSTNTTATTEANGMFSITRNNITSLSPFAVFETPAAGIQTVEDVAQVKLFPVPAVTNLNIATSWNGALTAAITNENGEYIRSVNFDPYEDKKLEVADLATGVYFIRLYNNEHSSVVKFTKQ
ncbi:MAG: T9SS type A sorting domain-containing protein [Chitinophagales bacterium]